MAPLSSDDQITLVVFTVLQLVCLVVMLISGRRILRVLRRLQRRRHVDGEVIALQQVRTSMRHHGGVGSRQVTLLKPVIRYQTPGGEQLELLHPVASSAPPPVGSRVRVAYDSRRPDRAEVVSGLALYLAPGLTLAAVTLVFVILVAVELSILR